MTEWTTDKSRWLRDLREKAEAFRAAMIESGAVNHVSQDLYMPQLRALEAALQPFNYLDGGHGEKTNND